MCASAPRKGKIRVDVSYNFSSRLKEMQGQSRITTECSFLSDTEPEDPRMTRISLMFDLGRLEPAALGVHPAMGKPARHLGMVLQLALP